MHSNYTVQLFQPITPEHRQALQLTLLQNRLFIAAIITKLKQQQTQFTQSNTRKLDKPTGLATIRANGSKPTH